MTDRMPRRRTGDPELDRRLLELLDGRADNREDRDLLFEMLGTVVGLGSDHADRLNLKITNAALKEMRQAFRVFAPYRDVPKVTIFGSARTRPDDPLYVQARDLAHALAGAGWMVVTGAGPGIMAAGAEGAGRARSIGVNIRLPFEQEANPFIAADPKLVSMKYFFTRKLMLMKESAGFVVLPGGFGTLDETFELLTLLQTGKAAPAPLVLLEVPGGTYWKAWQQFIQSEVAGRGLVDADDVRLAHVTDDVQDAVGVVLGFYRNYHSLRYVGDRLVVRLRGQPTDEEIEQLNRDFADILVAGRIERTGPLPPEVADGDHLELPRLALRFDRFSHARLRVLVDALNALPSAPEPAAMPDAAAARAAGTPPEDDREARGVVALDAAMADVLAGVADAQGDEQRALRAVSGIQDVLAAGDGNRDQQRAVAEDVVPLVPSAPSDRVRRALVDALASAAPAVGLEALLDLVVEHHAQLGDEELAAALEGLDRLLAQADAAGAGPQLRAMLRLTSPGSVIATLEGTRNGDVAERARVLRRRVERLTA